MSVTSQTTLLVAESDPLIRLVMCQYLRGCGIHVLEAAQAQEARSIVEAGLGLNAVIIDAQLGDGESGFSLSRWIRLRRPNLKVMLTSSLASKERAAASFCETPHVDAPHNLSISARLRAIRSRGRRSDRGSSARLRRHLGRR